MCACMGADFSKGILLKSKSNIWNRKFVRN
jgi:hypothetical protein